MLPEGRTFLRRFSNVGFHHHVTGRLQRPESAGFLQEGIILGRRGQIPELDRLRRRHQVRRRSAARPQPHYGICVVQLHSACTQRHSRRTNGLREVVPVSGPRPGCLQTLSENTLHTVARSVDELLKAKTKGIEAFDRTRKQCLSSTRPPDHRRMASVSHLRRGGQIMPGLFDRRYNHKTTIIASQFEPAEWPDQILIPVAAETITDRLCAQAYTIVRQQMKQSARNLRLTYRQNRLVPDG